MAPCMEPSSPGLNAKLTEAHLKPCWVRLRLQQALEATTGCVLWTSDVAKLQKLTVIRLLSQWVFIAPQTQEWIIPFFHKLELGTRSQIDG